MRIELDRSGNPEQLREMLQEMEADPKVRGILIFSCDENNISSDQIDPALQACQKPLFGGLFPQIIYQEEHLSRGTLVIGVFADCEVCAIPGLSERESPLSSEHIEQLARVNSSRRQTMAVFVDGFATRICGLLDMLFEEFGFQFNYVGGGAGSLSFQPKPCVFTNQGLLQDAVVLAVINAPSAVGVAHGWTPISDPYKVTESSGNVIHSLDWRPAFEVYREIVEQHSGQVFDSENFFDIAKAYPFGLAKFGSEMVVRDPLSRQEDSLVCVGEVAEGAYGHVLHGNNESLLSAAEEAKRRARESFGNKDASAQLLMDCISRVLFLGDEFSAELKNVHSPEAMMFGALSLGEIANCGDAYLEFYNKTAVVSLM